MQRKPNEPYPLFSNPQVSEVTPTTTNPTWTTESDYCPLTGDRPERMCEKCKGTGKRPGWFETQFPSFDPFGLRREFMKCLRCAGFGTLRGDDA